MHKKTGEFWVVLNIIEGFALLKSYAYFSILNKRQVSLTIAPKLS